VRFAFSDDQTLLRNSARTALEERCGPARVRAAWTDPAGHDAGLWADMAKLGWLGLPFPEEQGGAGLGLVELCIVLEELGRAAYPGPYFASVVLGGLALALGGSRAQQERWIPALASGERRLSAALLEESLDWDPAATAATAARRGEGWAISGLKRFVPWAEAADAVLVPARGPEGLSLFLVDPRAPGVSLRPLTGIDPGTRWAELRLADVAVGAEAVVGRPGTAGPLLEALLRRAAVCASAEMLGAARRCLDMAVDYAKVREQFGQPIGSFQAIRHRLAEMLADVENAHGAVYYAAWHLQAGSEDAAMAASVCKSYVSEVARRVCSDAIQVHGGIGFTWEYDLHLYMKRAKALEPCYGDADFHRELIVRQMTAR
jgi:alkylation response protein AidB-like acyl-CoA dehydrogenase